MLKHVVLFKFNKKTSEDDIKKLISRLGALPGQIPEIKGFEFGRDVVRSPRSFDFALVSVFSDLEAMKRYQVHPNHKDVSGIVEALCDEVIAVDFEI